MTTEKHILDSQQVAPPLPDNIGISQPSGLDHHAVFNRQRVDQYGKRAPAQGRHRSHLPAGYRTAAAYPPPDASGV